MLDDEIVREIVEKVLERLKFASHSPDHFSSGRRKVMVVVTGATIGAKTAFDGLKRLKTDLEKRLDYVLLFSRAAAEIYKPSEIGEKLNASEVLVEEKNSRTRATAVLKECDMVAVPALTRKTAARTAMVLLDSAVTEVLADALMRGLPVLASKDGADPAGEGFTVLGMNRSKPALIRRMQINLEQIASYGVTLVSSAEFGPALERMVYSSYYREGQVLPSTAGVTESFMARPRSRPQEKRPYGGRAVITRADIEELTHSDGVVRVSRGALITPLVMDMVRDAGLRIEEV
ncbi:MAG: hypothetical protein ACYC0Q_08265 [Eubacteriales bacterium]